MKGFTLIELLAVIVILAIIALIAVPLVMDVISDAKQSAAKSEAKLIVQAVENYCAAEPMKASLTTGYVYKCTASATVSAENLALMVDLGSATATIALDANKKVTATGTTITSNGCTVNPTTWAVSGC